MANPDREMVSCDMPSNLPTPVYFDTQMQHKAAWMQFIDRPGPALAVTLSWNTRRNIARCRENLGTFVAYAERRILGPRFHKKPPEKRLEAIFTFEGIGSNNIHAHSIWWPPRHLWYSFLKLFPRRRSGLWDWIVPFGSYEVKLLNLAGTNDEFTGYIMKEQGRNSEADTMVWASEFHRAR